MSLLAWPRNNICIGAEWHLENIKGSDHTAGKGESESQFLAEKYMESISVPVHEQLFRYLERLAFVLKPIVCPSTWWSCFHIVVFENEGSLQPFYIEMNDTQHSLCSLNWKVKLPSIWRKWGTRPLIIVGWIVCLCTKCK